MTNDWAGKATVISAFPATGKTYYCEHKRYDEKVLDSDSSKFSWVHVNHPDEMPDDCKSIFIWDSDMSRGRYRNPDFPHNYIRHIKENLDKQDLIFVSSHAVVRKALHDNNIPFLIVSPAQHLKSDWIERCIRRGNDHAFLITLLDNWDSWIAEIKKEEENGTPVIWLGRHEYIGHNSVRSEIGEYAFDLSWDVLPANTD